MNTAKDEVIIPWEEFQEITKLLGMDLNEEEIEGLQGSPHGQGER